MNSTTDWGPMVPIDSTACVSDEVTSSGELPPIVIGFLILFGYLAMLAIAAVSVLGGLLFVAQRFQRCPCPLCTGMYTKTRIIGKGSFGEVWLATGADTNGSECGRYAVKSIPIKDVSEANRGMEEATQLARCRHENLLHIERQFFHNERVLLGHPFTLCIVTELCLGDLREWTGARVYMEERDCLYLAAQLLEGLKALHEAGIVHGDIKPENILVASTGSQWHQTRYKIGDFGLSQRADEIDEHGFIQVGTRGYMAPEVRRGLLYDSAIDVWSTGILLLECMWGFGESLPSLASDSISDASSAEADLFAQAFGVGESGAGSCVPSEARLAAEAPEVAGGPSWGEHSPGLVEPSPDVVDLISLDTLKAIELAQHPRILVRFPTLAEQIVLPMLTIEPVDRPTCDELIRLESLQLFLSKEAQEYVALD